MAITELLFGEKKRLEIGDPSLTNVKGLIQFDAAVSETHTFSAEVASHPVEEGADITDHVRRQPISLEINGMVTNTPIVYLASVYAKQPFTKAKIPSNNRADDAFKELRKLQDDGVLVDVNTSLASYSNLIITGISVTRDVSNGNVLNASISLREIIKANALSVDLPDPKEIQNKNKKNKGKKQGTDASEKQSEKKTSIAAGLAGSLGF